MDGVIHDYPVLRAAMPERASLEMPVQDFAKAPALQTRAPRPGLDGRIWLWRSVAFVPPVIMTLAFVAAQLWGRPLAGIGMAEYAFVALSGFAFLWIALSVVSALIGLLGRRPPLRRFRPLAARKMTVALLIPIHNEDPSSVFGNAAALLEDLGNHPDAHNFSLYVLSDTRDLAVAAKEWEAFLQLRQEQGDHFPIYYRRRAKNTDRKTGNLADWVTGWGGRHEAMLVLDADSLMSAAAVLHLRDALAADPTTGLVQSWPRILRAESLFARVQQFVTAAHGWTLARGLAIWAGGESNYWGHNAIMRTQAFAAAAGLPHLVSATGKETLIMSHDFVEAAMLRRAGWRVRFLPEIDGSYEETPGTLMDYVLRDRRWCRGNLQHLRLLAARGLHPMSRFHMLQGAVAYLLSPIWLALMLVAAFPATTTGAPGLVKSWLFPLVMLMLLGPKLVSAVVTLGSAERRAQFGGAGAFALATLTEMLVSMVYAPVLMVQQVLSVVSAAVSARDIWAAQRRDCGPESWRALMRFHKIETLLGLLALAGIADGAVTIWLTPIALSLACAIPLSRLSGLRFAERRAAGLRMDTAEHLNPPAIQRAATAARARFGMALRDRPEFNMAAE